MIALLLAGVVAYGVHLVYSATVFNWQGIQPGPDLQSTKRGLNANRVDLKELATTYGLGSLDLRALVAASAVIGLFGFAFGTILFGGLIPGLVLALFAATAPVAAARVRHERTIAKAHQAWPTIIEEIRLLSGTLGRSIPQATFEVGARAPEGLRQAFADAQREWLVTTDFARSLDVLKSKLAHNTVDVVAETLLTAHELGGGEVGRRLAALAEDRLTDQQHRRDAEARQAGVRFARYFVLFVPFGMATAGLSIGSGRAAYGSSSGQMLVVVALLLVIACWIWAGRIMRLPVEDRVFS